MAHKKQHECAKEKWGTNMDSDMAMPQVLHGVALVSARVVLLALLSVAYPLLVTASRWITFWKVTRVDVCPT